MTLTMENRSWKELCEAASKERDSKQLIVLVTELIKALDEQKISARNLAQ
jgi:hypothetical protein